MQKKDRHGGETLGTIDGQAAVVEYLELQEVPQLRWRKLQDKDAANSSTDNQSDKTYKEILGEDIIGTIADGDEGYKILAIEHANPSTGNEQPEIQCRIIQASHLPPKFLDTFLIKNLPAHLSITSEANDDNGLNIHILISTGSGIGEAISFSKHVLQPTLSALGIPRTAYQKHQTTSAQSISELTTTVFLPRARKGIAQTLILLSGDGGVHDILNGLFSSRDVQSSMYRPPTIGLLALGTGNALAHSLRILTSSSSSLGLRTILFGTPRPLPSFRAWLSPGAKILTDEGRSTISIPNPAGRQEEGERLIYGAIVLSYGLHASIVADSDTSAYRKHGSSRFQLAAKELLFPSDGHPPHAYHARVSFLKRPSPQNTEEEAEEEWTPISRQYHSYVLTTLVSQLERNFTISPASNPSHQQTEEEEEEEMHLIHIPPLPGKDMAQLMQLAYDNGKHIQDERVGYEAVEGVRIELVNDGNEEEERWRRICVDGKIVRLEPGGWVDVRLDRTRGEKRAMDVICP